MNIQDTPAYNNGKGESHFSGGPRKPGQILYTKSLAGREREIKEMLTNPGSYNVAVIVECGSDNTLMIQGLAERTPDMELIPIGDMLFDMLRISSKERCLGPRKMSTSLLRLGSNLLVVCSAISQCVGVMLQTQGIGGRNADHNMRMNHWGIVEQIRLLMSKDHLMLVRPFLTTTLGRNGLGDPRPGAMRYDLSYPGMGGFPRTCNDLFDSDMRGKWGVSDLSWFLPYFHSWVGGPGETVNIAFGTIEEVDFHTITGEPDLVVSKEFDPTGRKTINAINYLHAWSPGGEFGPLVPFLSSDSYPSKSYVDAIIEEQMIIVGVGRYGLTQLSKARAGAKGGPIGGKKNYGADEDAPTAAANRNKYKKKGSKLSTKDAKALGGKSSNTSKNRKPNAKNAVNGKFNHKKSSHNLVRFTLKCTEPTKNMNLVLKFKNHMLTAECQECWDAMLDAVERQANDKKWDKQISRGGPSKEEKRLYRHSTKIKQQNIVLWNEQLARRKTKKE